MKKNSSMILGIGVVVGVAAVIGCNQRTDPDPYDSPGVGERSGAALDRAAEDTAEAARRTAEATKDAAADAAERSGEALEDAGERLEQAGEDMRREAND